MPRFFLDKMTKRLDIYIYFQKKHGRCRKRSSTRSVLYISRIHKDFISTGCTHQFRLNGYEEKEELTLGDL